MPCQEFLAEVVRVRAYDAPVRHLAIRLEDRQIAVLDRVTLNAEQRLAKIIFGFAEKFGVRDGSYVRIEQRLSREELSQFVGTTRLESPSS